MLRILHKMVASIAHRGPDGEGFWINKKENAGLAHRRLSIIDLSEEAAQPMHYARRYSIVYNGEIYNYIELRKELKSPTAEALNGIAYNTKTKTFFVTGKNWDKMFEIKVSE